MATDTIKPQHYLERAGELHPDTQNALRAPAGHPEGYLEAFANIYSNFAAQIHAFKQGDNATNSAFDVPGINEAVRGMAFIEHVVASSKQDTKWHKLQIG